ncbi:glycosyltransferase family 4 protein [Photobacterium kasasachensis]|uniref:glycosyltransferase family 4 protein n=1 Tax=Photobacterium kasasachensis TaxID=2910240 RepID=UPI003D0EF209
MLVVNARFLTQDLTGVQRFAIEISKELKKYNTKVVFVAPHNIKDKILAEYLDVQVIGNSTGHLWEQVELPLYLKRKCANATLINFCNTAPILYCNKVSTVHDIAFIKWSKSFSKSFSMFYKFLIPLIIKSSKRLVTVSEFSKTEIERYYKLSSSPFIVIHNAVDDSFKGYTSNYKKDNYILAVSSLNSQKNFEGLLNAFHLTNDNTLKLKIVGSRNQAFSNSVFTDKDFNDRIEFLGRVSDEELKELYSNAKCFVYPSFYEGFGIPPLEAQSCLCPVIVSDAASLPEVCKDSVLYCDPYDPIDIAAKIDLVCSDYALTRRLIDSGIKNIERFSWEKSALAYMNLID